MYVCVPYATVPLFLLAAIVIAADNPFSGTWTLNLKKSKFTGAIMKYEATPSGESVIRAAASHKFETDGKEYSGLFGWQVTWTQVDDNTWAMASKINGKFAGDMTTRISPDGKTMTVIYRVIQPSGESFENTYVYDRISGGPGLLGTWLSKDVKIGRPNTLVIQADGDARVTFRLLDYDAICNANLMGKIMR